jgi:hypothetical protein
MDCVYLVQDASRVGWDGGALGDTALVRDVIGNPQTDGPDPAASRLVFPVVSRPEILMLWPDWPAL